MRRVKGKSIITQVLAFVAAIISVHHYSRLLIRSLFREQEYPTKPSASLCSGTISLPSASMDYASTVHIPSLTALTTLSSGKRLETHGKSFDEVNISEHVIIANLHGSHHSTKQILQSTKKSQVDADLQKGSFEVNNAKTWAPDRRFKDHGQSLDIVNILHNVVSSSKSQRFQTEKKRQPPRKSPVWVNLQKGSFEVGDANVSFVDLPRNVISCHPGTEVVLMIVSAPDNTARRLAMRQAWVGKRKAMERRRILANFLIGLPGDEHGYVNTSSMQALRSESRRFGDLIVYNHLDVYRRLTYKVVKG